MITVALYGVDGAPLSEPTGALARPAGLTFATGLPGGFLDARFSLPAAAARALNLRPGLRTIVWRGAQVLWWGWVEDVSYRVRGAVAMAEVACLGPWQEVQQRLFSANYSNVASNSALADALAAHCPNVSRDTRGLAETGVQISVSWSYRPVSELVRLVCDAGNSAGQPLLFALWEPSFGRAYLGNTANLLSDPELEFRDQYWYLGNGQYANWDTTNYHSPVTCMLFAEFAQDGLAHRAKVAVQAGAPYTVEYWHRYSAHTGMSSQSRVDWFTAGDQYISSTYGPSHGSSGTAEPWVYRAHVHTAPANAATARPIIAVSVGSGVGKWVAIDDVRMYLAAVSLPTDDKPRPVLWPRDLSDWDYLLYTRFLREAATVEASTRELANYVLVAYGSSYTAAGQDFQSQTLYRRRDAVLNAGNISQATANAMRDVYLAAHKAPATQMRGVAVPKGAVWGRSGEVVDPAVLRAGHRLRLADGPLAGRVILLQKTEWRDGVMTVTPEDVADVPLLLAKK